MLNPALGRGALDRCADRRMDTVWIEAAHADPTTVVVAVSNDGIAMSGATLANVAAHQETSPEDLHLLGRIADVVYFAAAGSSDLAYSSLRDIGASLSDDDAAIATVAIALSRWHESHKHCTRCGAPTRCAAAGWERHCSVDGSAHYPRTDAAVIVRILDDNERLLLARSPAWPERRMSLVAGYVEPGETLEHAVKREVLEEVGLSVAHPTFVASQPWPFPASLMVCFDARATHTDIRVDGMEIESAEWFSRDELEAAVTADRVRMPSHVSIARKAIEDWLGRSLPGD